MRERPAPSDFATSLQLPHIDDDQVAAPAPATPELMPDPNMPPKVEWRCRFFEDQVSPTRHLDLFLRSQAQCMRIGGVQIGAQPSPGTGGVQIGAQPSLGALDEEFASDAESC